MSGYTKLFSSIVHSTIWREDADTKVLWVTMLALADREGEVMASVPGLADVARISIEKCEEALAKFLAPDPYSRTPDNEGRRVEKIQGGWAILNYGLYREMQSEAHKREMGAERQRRFRERNAEPLHVTNCNASSRSVTTNNYIPEAEAEAEANKITTTPLPPKGGAQPEKDNSPVVAELPCTGKANTFEVTEKMSLEWMASFPGVDIKQALRSMRAWLIANPTRQKTHRGIPSFCVNWLNREQNRVISQHRPTGQTPGRRAQSCDDALLTQLNSHSEDFPEMPHVR